MKNDTTTTLPRNSELPDWYDASVPGMGDRLAAWLERDQDQDEAADGPHTDWVDEDPTAGLDPEQQMEAFLLDKVAAFVAELAGPIYREARRIAYAKSKVDFASLVGPLPPATDGKLARLLQAAALCASGYGGCDKAGQIVDRRENPDAVPLQENSMFGTPAPFDRAPLEPISDSPSARLSH